MSQPTLYLPEPSFTCHIESENGRAFIKRLRNWCELNGMNYMKFLCLRWEHNTNKKCTNKKHRNGIYGKELECEAQLVECINLQVEFSGISHEDEERIFEALEKAKMEKQ